MIYCLLPLGFPLKRGRGARQPKGVGVIPNSRLPFRAVAPSFCCRGAAPGRLACRPASLGGTQVGQFQAMFFHQSTDFRHRRAALCGELRLDFLIEPGLLFQQGGLLRTEFLQGQHGINVLAARGAPLGGYGKRPG